MIELSDEPTQNLELAASWEFVTWQPEGGAEPPGTAIPELAAADESPMQLADTWDYVRWTPPAETDSAGTAPDGDGAATAPDQVGSGKD